MCACVHVSLHCNCSTHFCFSNRRLCSGPLRRRRLERAQVLPNASIIRFCGQSTQFSATGHAAYVSVRVFQCVCVCVSEWPQRGWGVKVHLTSKLACAFFPVCIATSASYSLLFCCSLVLFWFRRFTAAVLSISCVIFSIIYVCACLCTIVCFCFPHWVVTHTQRPCETFM